MYSTNYSVAVNWLHNDFILCNNIPEIDPSVFDNMRFSLYRDDDDQDDDEDNYDDEKDTPSYELHHPDCDREIFQWYLTNCSDEDVAFLEEHFGLLFTYSDTLELYVLCVDHFGTSWSYVHCDTDLENAIREEGQER